MLIDTYGRKIDYLRISVTDRCNLRCRYCMPRHGIISRSRRELLSFEEIVSIVKASARSGIENIRLTGGEPLVRRDLPELVASLDKICGIKDISLTTNGILLKERAGELRKAGLKRLNVSLDSLTEERYRWITRRGKLDDVLEGIDEAFNVGFSLIKINVLLLDDLTRSEIQNFLALSIEDPMHVRFLEFMPIGSFYKIRKFISGKEVLEIARRFGDVEEAANYGNGPARAYRFKNSIGTFGIITPVSDKFCFGCNRLRLTSDGFLKSCLHSDVKVNLRDPLRKGADREELSELIKSAVRMKPREHSMNERVTKSLEHSMCQIGG